MEQEQHIIWLVQFWTGEPYNYWHTCMEPATGLFEIPRVGFEQEEEGRQKLAAMREAYPDGKYRLIRQTTTVDVVG